MQSAENINEIIYALEALAYYFSLKPNEFWNMTYKEINLFCKMNMIKMQDNFKQQIILEEAVTNKLIQADSMSKKPKIVPLQKTFKELFANK